MSTLIPPREHPVVRRVFVQQLSEFSIGVLAIYFTDFRDHLAPRFVPLPIAGLFVKLLNDTLSGGPILQRKLGNDAAQFVGLGELDFVQGNAEPKAKFIETIHYPSVYFAQDHDTFSAIG